MKLFISTCKINYNIFNLYWSQAKRKEIKIMSVIYKNLTIKIVLKYRTNFINQSHVILQEIHKLDLKC